MPTVSEGVARGARLALLALLPVAAFANVVAYVAHAGNPLVSSDAWYFVDAFLRPVLESGPGLQDFYVKRESMDHAQPLLKLLLWINAAWFGLDFVVESLMGILFAAGTFLLLVVATRGDRGLQPPWLRGLLLGALALVLVTLNSGMVFDWSLVTLNYVPYFFAVLAALAAWRAVATGRFAALAAAAFVVAAAFDGVGLVIGAAIAGSTALAAARLGRWRAAGIAIAVVVAAQLAYRLLEPLVLDGAQPTGTVGAGTQLQVLLGFRGEWLDIARIVLGSTFVHLHQAMHHYPGNPEGLQAAFALAAVALHAWFWWRALKGPFNAAAFHAVVLMLLFYGLSAAIVYARVPLNGVGYLHEPRYVGIYLLANVALVVMLLGQRIRAAAWGTRSLAVAGLAGLLALQVALSAYTWREGRFLYLYYHRMAGQMLALGADPDAVPPDCLPLLPVCRMPAESRREVMALLQRHGLNIYSPAFAERYGLEPLVDHYRREPARQDPIR